MRPDIHIPFEDLTRQYQQIKDEINVAITEVLPTGKYVMGNQLTAFEEEFAAYHQTRFCAGISSGTEALHLALLACGVGPGDEVITVPNTYIATVFAISYTGATPVFVDVDPATHNIDPREVEKKITPRTKVILPVHLYGQCVDMDALMEIAGLHHLYVIEDAAHAHGALYKGRKAGSLGHIGCFSFYPTKVMGAYGDGGAITTNDPELLDRVKVLRYMGQHQKYLHEKIGFQQRLGEIQAAILRVKLRHLEDWIDLRRKRARQYSELLRSEPVRTPVELAENRHVFYMYAICAPRRDELQVYLAEKGIGCTPVYPLEVPFQPAYADLGYRKGDFPVSDSQVDEILCLPMFPELTEAEVMEVADRIHAFYSQ
jgi:dTDP-4-amino-4,6-dideoxygalactose transaminase